MAKQPDGPINATRYWTKHLLGCQRKGKEAFHRGEPRDSCPYKVIDPYGQGARNMTKLRTQYWHYGWDLANEGEDQL
jgi:hypothetical protein